MASKRIRLTPELSKQIGSAIYIGGYPYVAAESWGVPKDVFDDWLKRGNAKNAKEPYRSFAEAVREAFAQARLRAEAEGYKKDPRHWLVHGPGRENEQRPGWSGSVKPAESATESRNVWLDPELLQLFRQVLKALEPFPEARAGVAQALTDAGMKQAA
jgi:hypothetical protein